MSENKEGALEILLRGLNAENDLDLLKKATSKSDVAYSNIIGGIRSLARGVLYGGGLGAFLGASCVPEGHRMEGAWLGYNIVKGVWTIVEVFSFYNRQSHYEQTHPAQMNSLKD